MESPCCYPRQSANLTNLIQSIAINHSSRTSVSSDDTSKNDNSVTGIFDDSSGATVRPFMTMHTNLIVRITVIMLLTCFVGCVTTTPSAALSATSSVETTTTPTKLMYRTSADRLNLASASASSLADMENVGREMLLPSLTECTLLIDPHPNGNLQLVRAQLKFFAMGGAKSTDNFVRQITGVTEESSAHAIEVWTLDIPAWQLDAIVKKLRGDNFFRRSRVLNLETTLGIRVDGHSFAKEYKAVPELDALIFRIRQHGHKARERSTLANADGSPLQRLSRLPAI